MIWYDMIWYIWYDIWYDIRYMIWYDIWCDMMIWYIWYDTWYMMYLLTAIGLTTVAVVQYTFTHKQYIEQHK